MRLEWIDDILAVLDTGSLARAAEKRLLTQSAFTRRVRIIEESIGAPLFDRRRKPVKLMPGVLELEPELRELSARLHHLRHSMKMASERAAQSLSFVCQHALTTTISPQVVLALSADGQLSTRVRSGNQDECLMQLISKEAEFAIMYALPEDDASEPGNAFEAVTLGTDLLIPVATPHVRSALGTGALPIISYPSEVFFGKLFARKINPELPQGLAISTVAETALTLAMLQLVLKDIGAAWLPQSLIGEHLSRGELVRLDDLLPTQTLLVRLVRLAEPQPAHAERAWQHISKQMKLLDQDM